MRLGFVIWVLSCCADPAPPRPPVYHANLSCTSRPAYATACAETRAAPSFEAGVLEGESFTAFLDGANNLLPLHSGPQGGYHAFIDVRSTELCPSWVLTALRLRLPGESNVLRLQQFEQALLPIDPGSGLQQTGQLVFFVCPSQLRGVSLVGVPLELEVSVGDCTGPSAKPEMSVRRFAVVPTCPEGDALCASNGQQGCAAP